MVFATHVIPTPIEEPLEGCGFAKLVVDIDGWYRKVMRVASLKKIIAFWRKYRRQNHQATNQWTATSTGNLRITIAKNRQRQSLDLSISISEFRSAENTIFSATQKIAFAKEWRNLHIQEIYHPNTAKEMTMKNSPLITHNPFLDEFGIIRVGSRLVNSNIRRGKISHHPPTQRRKYQSLHPIHSRLRAPRRRQTYPQLVQTEGMDHPRPSRSHQRHQKMHIVPKSLQKAHDTKNGYSSLLPRYSSSPIRVDGTRSFRPRWRQN